MTKYVIARVSPIPVTTDALVFFDTEAFVEVSLAEWDAYMRATIAAEEAALGITPDLLPAPHPTEPSR